MSVGLPGQTLAVVLAGGVGSRLGALTRERSKPALPFGGRCRSIDFTLSNCVNSGVRRIAVATQYQSQSLIHHLQQTWGFLHRESGAFVEPWSAGQRRNGRSYAGTADAVYQNLDAIELQAPRYVLVLAADQVYRMNYAALLAAHWDSEADVTVACQPVPSEQACHFGIMSVDGSGEISRFDEKPLGLTRSGEVLASMGIYVFEAGLLRRLLCEDAGRVGSRHDFGRDLIPACVRHPGIRAGAYRFRDPCTGGPGYWRDIGTVDAYWAANMEMLAPEPELDLYDPRWPIWSMPDRSPPTRIPPERRGLPTLISRSLVAGGCEIKGAVVRNSILFKQVRVGPGSVIEESILLPGASIGAGCRINRAIVDENFVLEAGTTVGGNVIAQHYDCEISPGGVTVVAARNASAGIKLPVSTRRRVNAAPLAHELLRKIGSYRGRAIPETLLEERT